MLTSKCICVSIDMHVILSFSVKDPWSTSEENWVLRAMITQALHAAPDF